MARPQHDIVIGSITTKEIVSWAQGIWDDGHSAGQSVGAKSNQHFLDQAKSELATLKSEQKRELNDAYQDGRKQERAYQQFIGDVSQQAVQIKREGYEEGLKAGLAQNAHERTRVDQLIAEKDSHVAHLKQLLHEAVETTLIAHYQISGDWSEFDPTHFAHDMGDKERRGWVQGLLSQLEDVVRGS